MQLGIIGLGRMGGNIARRLMRAGHRTVVHDRNRDAITGLEGEGAQGAHDLGALVQKLKAPRAVWVMLLISITSDHARNHRSCWPLELLMLSSKE